MPVMKNRAVRAAAANRHIRGVAATTVVVHPVTEHALQLELLHTRPGAPHHLLEGGGGGGEGDGGGVYSVCAWP